MLTEYIASISAVEGQNWRHGDIEDTLLNILMARVGNGGNKFSKLDVKRVYFGNWLRDYSQAVDVGTVKYVSAEAIRLLLWVLGFSTFGYGAGEFQVTMDRLGCYRPEEHIDNPKDYADNLDARQYDKRLRGPVDERRELSIDPQTGLKSYIASEQMGITTSASMLRIVFGQCIKLGRQYARKGNKEDLYEALRLLGHGCHCLEDFSAHSNYCELALIELGEQDVFPHVGRQTKLNLPGVPHPVYPIVTGTFGGTDFMYSVMGEFGDRATQSELQELKGTLQSSQSSGQNFSILQNLLASVPSGLFGDEDQAGKMNELQLNAQAAQIQNTHITPRQPEAWTKQLEVISTQIYPILEWHDEIMKSITEFIEKIPMLPDLIEQLQDQVNIFVFTLLAPLVVPIIDQVKTELSTGSSDIIKSSQAKQLVVFHDDHSSDPTHSMLSKDHFSNILNEPAGKVASHVLKWVVPQIMACWDDERIDVNRTLNRILAGVFHHPALRDRGEDGAVDGRRAMFQVMQQWWSQKDESERIAMQSQLSRDGVQQGRNQKEGVHDTGHGCGVNPPTALLGKTAGSSGLVSGMPVGNLLGQINAALAGQSQFDPGARPSGGKGPSTDYSRFVSESLGGGVISGIAGGLAGGIGGDLLGQAFGDTNVQKQIFSSQQSRPDGSYTQNVMQTGYQSGQPAMYGQAEYSQTTYPGGGQRQEYQRYGQGEVFGKGGYSEQVIREDRPAYGGGYEQRTETHYERTGNEWQSDVVTEDYRPGGQPFEERQHYVGNSSYAEELDSDEERRKHDNNRRHNKSDTEYFNQDFEERARLQQQTHPGVGGFRDERSRNEETRRREMERQQKEDRLVTGRRSEEERFESNTYGDENRQQFPREFESGRPTYETERIETRGNLAEEFDRQSRVRQDNFESGQRYDTEIRERIDSEEYSRDGENFEEAPDRGYGQAEDFGERRDYGDDY